jgi:hypothetical protein
MKDRNIIVEAAGLLAAVGISIIAVQAGERTWRIDPGFVPDTGRDHLVISLTERISFALK